MKKSLFQLFRKNIKWEGMIYCVALLLTSTLLISCENFLNGGDVRHEIEDIIAYNNAKIVNVSLSCDSSIGTLFPNQTYQARLGYEFEIQFIPNTNEYQIKDFSKIFEAVSLRDDSDRSEYVQIQVKEQSQEDKKSGVYRASITVIKETDDIKIRPVCISLPKILKMTPENKKNGDDQDTPITIEFNKPVDPQTFDITCISITDGENDLNDKFDTPVFNIGNTILTIPAKKDTLILAPDGAKREMEIFVSIDTTNLKDCDGISIPAFPTHQYKINTNFGNQKKVSVLIKTIDGTGSFLEDGTRECIAGFSLGELQFTVNKNYCIYTGLEAVNKNNPSIKLNDHVIFTPVSSDEANGVYTTKVSIIDQVENLLIQPTYIQRPVIVSTSPQYVDEGKLPTEAINITFNQSFEGVTNINGTELFSFDNISIKCQGMDISDCFEAPVLSEDKKTVIITPNIYNFSRYLRSKQMILADVTVTLDDSKMYFNIQDKTVQIANNNYLSFKVRYNPSSIESTPPEKVDFNIFRSYENGEGKDNIGMALDYNWIHGNYGYKTSWMDRYIDDYLHEDDMLENRTKGDTVYITGKFIDYGSGVKTVKVQEEWIDTYYFYGEEGILTTTYKAGDPRVLLWKKSADNSAETTFVIKHKLLADDGLVHIKTFITDGYDNENIQDLTVFKVGSVNLGEAHLHNIYYSGRYYISDTSFCEGDTPSDFDMDEYETELKNIKLIYDPYDSEEYCHCNFYFFALLPNFQIDPEEIYTKIECEYIDDDGIPHKEEMEKYYYDENDPDGIKNWNHTLINVSDVSGLSVKVTVTDDLGNKGSETFQFPTQYAVINNEPVSSNISEASYSHFGDSTGNTTTNALVVFKDDNEDWKAFKCYDYSVTFLKDYTYQIIPFDTDSLTGSISKEFNYDTETSLAKVELNGEITLESKPFNPAKEDNANTYINIPIKPETWNTYSKVLVQLAYDASGTTNKIITIFENKETILKPELYTGNVINFGNNCTNHKASLYGITENGQVSRINTISIPIPQDYDEWVSYDNQLPTVYGKRESDYKDRYYLSITDSQSGPKSLTTYVNGKRVFDRTVTADYPYNNINQTIEIYDYITEFTSDSALLSFTITGKDNNNNIQSQKVEETIFRDSPIYVARKSNDENIGWTFYTEGAFNSALVQKFNQSQNNWVECYKDIPSTANSLYMEYSNGSSLVYIPLTRINNYFIRLKNGDSIFQYYFIGLNDSNDFLNSGRYDYLKPNGLATDSVIISSDAPVFVHTLVSSFPYETCKYWSIEDWEFYKKELGPQEIDYFSRFERKYYIPMTQIKTGQCYVVIAYFADGTSQMSEVMVKN